MKLFYYTRPFRNDYFLELGIQDNDKNIEIYISLNTFKAFIWFWTNLHTTALEEC